ncbi:MAG: peptidylprolyl isomerase [Deltaproteobacteria bacterium]|nr:peptidylprolyl isomerase [Deltaproteobacteria bacterium]
MRSFFIVVACFVVASCASTRFEKLAASAESVDQKQLDKLIPAPVEAPENLTVTHRVEITTSMGAMVVGLYGDAAPKTVRNFLAYVESGFFEGLIFHRVIPGFMIQGGGYTPDMDKRESEEPIPLELIPGIDHVAGTISMARTTEPDSATSQFFICVARTEQLNGEYAAFGRLEQGIDVASAISQVSTHSVESELAVMDDVPETPVIIQKMTILK